MIQLLRQVPNVSLWGAAIHATLKKPTKKTVEELIVSLRSQAKDNPQMMRDILSGVIYDKIINL